jgi:hypothetical protein
VSGEQDVVLTFDPGNLPQDWQPATIDSLMGKAGVFVDGDWVESKDQDPDGDVRLIQLADIGDGEYRDRSNRFLTTDKARKLSCTLLEPGDLLIARMPEAMTLETIERDFKKKVSSKIRLKSEGQDRYRVFTPFIFEDGDHLAIVLKRENDSWSLTDEGHTYMRLSYDTDEKDPQRSNRKETVSNALSVFQVEDRNGELIRTVCDNQFGDALFSYIQAVMRIAELSEQIAPGIARLQSSSDLCPAEHP